MPDAWSRSRRPGRCRLAQFDLLCAMVTTKLETDWSLSQVAGWIKGALLEDGRMYVPHATIHRSPEHSGARSTQEMLLAHLRALTERWRPWHEP